MKLISWNVNGIRAVHRKNLLQPLIDQEQPDIICFQETKAQPHESPVDLPEYTEYWHSAQKRGYSGVAIFSKVEPLSIQLGFVETVAKKYNLSDSYGDTTTEGRVITAEYKDFYLVNVYTPNSKADLSRLEMREKNWDPAFLEHCSLLQEKKPVIFCGDLNVAHTPDDLANPQSNERTHGFTLEERSGIDKIIKTGFIDTFRMFTQGNGHYSWWSNFGNARARNVGWRIDYWFVSQPLQQKVTASRILMDHMGSDHAPTVLEIKL
jgi:exodeoxyribonuclease-3